MKALTVSQVTKHFGATTALAGVDLHVTDGSVTAVLGPSGCGKTTLLRLVAGFGDPDAGTIELGGRQVFGPGRSVPAQRRGVGYVPQEGALFPHVDVAANIGFGLPRTERRAGRRAAKLLDLVGLDAGLAHRFPHQLSGGQQQRVALARALAPRPALVLLDEPFSSLDAGLRLSTANAVVEALRANGTTALLVTHDQNEALSLADQVAVMAAGRIAQVGPPRDVYSMPGDPVVAAFVGAAVFVPAVVTGLTASCDLGTLPVAAGGAEGAARVLIRPEQIRLLGPADGTDGAHDSGRNGDLVGEVTEIRYFGHDATVQLQLTRSGLTVTARIPGDQLPSPGARVRLAVAGPVTAYSAPG
ncbi:MULTISPECIES: ABC transporter ATP-binding protein [unclassified Pseudofrankia]|uniref:ABC transporter ATP-binding protein n=1 Tax=unclassified Pseudofrankia TaxID=2994372 RepID=UPI0008DB2C65|nr:MULTISPECIES: ABC transporter ATP-binding protein [unclassified Pseudofrankia]MDT3444518.1 ABC transporter ATP-binding protein [Pseudofrankia sp. BMG5.37]OHV56396.1 sugar ABC transporter [Pseudofrankia sp. BMG5.36]